MMLSKSGHGRICSLQRRYRRGQRTVHALPEHAQQRYRRALSAIQRLFNRRNSLPQARPRKIQPRSHFQGQPAPAQVQKFTGSGGAS